MLSHDEVTKTRHLTKQAVSLVSQAGGASWLQALAPRLAQLSDHEEAAAALGELRAYGGLVEAGFDVAPVPCAAFPTPDFMISLGAEKVAVEVFTRHQDARQKALQAAIADGQTPAGVERRVRHLEGGRSLTTVMSVHQPFGAPDPSKSNESVQANVVSRLCSAKGDELQFRNDEPSLLWIDLRGAGLMSGLVKVEQAAPLISGHHGLTSGGIWNAFYGWKGAPLFEEDFFPLERIVRMGHDGRYRLGGSKKSKLSGAIIALEDDLILLENPWALHALPPLSRRHCERLPWFNITFNVADWSKGDAQVQIELGRRQIESLKVWHDQLNAD